MSGFSRRVNNKCHGKEYSLPSRRKQGFKPTKKKLRSGKGVKMFQKFVDNNHITNDSECWSKCDCLPDNTNNIYHRKEIGTEDGIYSWIRKKPVNPIIKESHTSFKPKNEVLKHSSDTQEALIAQNEFIEIKSCYASSTNSEESNVHHGGNGSSVFKSSKVTTNGHSFLKIKEERNTLPNLKEEILRFSESSPLNQLSSSEEKVKHKPPLKEIQSALANNTPLSIKLKPKHKSVSPSQLDKTKNIEKMEHLSVASAVYYKESSHRENSRDLIELNNTYSAINKPISEDEVVCMGSLENKIVLEDDDDETHEKTDVQNTKSTYNNLELPNASEKCIICDKKGHSSFECQMICKNCSAPYHGYRSCPLPPNLSTTVQLLMEFCIQQFQNFDINNQISKNSFADIVNPQINSAYLESINYKAEKNKNNIRNNTRTRTCKNNGMSPFKKRKNGSYGSGNAYNNEYNTYDETTSDGSEDISDSLGESLLSSKRKHEMRKKNTTKAMNSTNLLNVPVFVNGFQGLAIPTTSLQSSNTSPTAFNTLLLTEMFQNAISSFKK